MLDLKLLRSEPDAVRAALARRGAEGLLEDVLAADERRREIVSKADAKRGEQNEASKAIAGASPDDRPKMIEEAKRLKAEVEALEEQEKEADEQLEMLAANLPNLPDPQAPEGLTEEDAEEIRTWGDPKVIPDARDHLDIGRLWGIIDTDRAARASGTRFAYLMGEIVFLEFALVRFALDRLTPHGFTPVVPPVLVNRDVMFGAGALPGDEAQYYVVQDGQYLTGTSEQALAALHADEDLRVEELPKRYTAFSTCFRREAGTYGRDTRGIFRVHQFDKVEMFSFAPPEASTEEHDFLVSRQEELLQALELPYRAMNIAAGDLGAPAARKIDLEAWFPGQGRYREVTSCSNCTDYQARRLHIRMVDGDDKRILHTLNGTAFAIGRTVAAILENHQRPDGSVSIPRSLHPYLPEDLHTIPRSR